MEPEQDINQQYSRSVDTKMISLTVTVLVIFLIINPAWIDKGGFGSGIGIFILGWAGILMGIISWYWFIGYKIFINSLKSGSFWKWSPLKKVTLILFLLVCSFTVLSFIRLGEIAPGDIDCQCQEITQFGAGYYLYQLLLWYLIIIIVSLSVVKRSESDESLNKIIRKVSFVALGLSIIVIILYMPLIFIQFGFV